MADAVKQLIDLPAGRRPLRMVVGPDFTDAVAEYNQSYERLRAHLGAVLSRSDQAMVWSRTTPRPSAYYRAAGRRSPFQDEHRLRFGDSKEGWQ